MVKRMVLWQDDDGPHCYPQLMNEFEFKSFKTGLAGVREERPEALARVLKNPHSFFAVRVTMKGKSDV